MKFWRLIASDYGRYRAAGGSALGTIFLTQGFWASCIYRLAHAGRRVTIPGVRHFFIALGILANKWIEIITGISLPAACEVDDGLYIGHFGPIIISSQTKIGRNCNLSQGVTLGVAGRGEKRGAPTLGDRVYVGANAIIIGKISIGADAAIGAGSVVTKDVPPRGVVVGNPARLLSHGGSFEFVRYQNMENDPARQSALREKEQEMGEASALKDTDADSVA